jgi:hypothetical protein
MLCDYLDPNGNCTGQYKGFACIKDKCRAEVRKRCQFSTPEGFYCLKYRRFECVGPENCATLEQYLEFIKRRRERSRA